MGMRRMTRRKRPVKGRMGDEQMKTKILALATVIAITVATNASAATRLIGTGCCPLCK
jgi:hypothetical protein